jgi:hypothetical protein
MRKQWVAMLSLLGLAGPAVRLQSQVLKGSSQAATNENNRTATNKSVKTGQTAQKTTGNAGKLNVNQQTLRQQNQASGTGGKQADPLTPSAYCNGRKQGTANNQLTPPPPGAANQSVTKTNNVAVTKTGRNGQTAVTKTGRDGQTAVTKTGRDGQTAVTKTGRDGQTAVTKTGRDGQLNKTNNLPVNQQTQTTAAAVPK